MIKVNELRLGNYFIPIIKGIDSPQRRLELSDFITIHHKPEYAEPILLTNEVLLKCGFKEDKDGCIMIPYSDSYNLYWLDCGRLQIAQGYAPLMNSPCKYLHQLQNLMFDFTAKELEINL